MIRTKNNFPGTYIKINKDKITEEKFNNLKKLYPKATIILNREDIKNKLFLYSYKEITFQNEKSDYYIFPIYNLNNYTEFKIDYSFKSYFFDALFESYSEKQIFYPFNIKLNDPLPMKWEEIPINLLGEIRWK